VDVAHLIAQLVIAEYTHDSLCDEHTERQPGLAHVLESEGDGESPTHQPLADLQARLNELLADDPDKW